MADPVLLKIINKCKKSPEFFINNFCKVKHPKLGIIPFKLFSYQKRCLREFQKNRFNIFRKCRQCGISTLTGAFALWYGMFFSNKTILIVSKRDDDAKDYLNKNIKLVYEYLPDWMKKIWVPSVINEHSIGFTNGSLIKSLTSSPDTLRSQSGSLNIIDEAAFIERMDDMWKGGWSTLQHGGSVIVISTPKGVGNWYYKTWSGAINRENQFNPILINWWDMDWKLDYVDELSGQKMIISPTREIKKLEEEQEIEKYGPYWSPWLEGEYQQLSSQGDDSGFRQEVLAEFIGSGATVLSRNALFAVSRTTQENCLTMGMVDYINPNSGEHEELDFNNMLWIWEKPYTARDVEKAVQEARANNTFHELTPEQKTPHLYVLGADTSTGESDDYCGIVVLDLITRRQVAELKIKTLPKIFARMVDFVGRMYNGAFVVCERTGIGQAVCQELDYYLMYPNLYRHKKVAASLKLKYNQIGFPTSHSTKPILVKHLVDNIGEDGYEIRSTRLYHELCTFIHLGNGKYGNEPGVGNSDDLVLALTFALVGIDEAMRRSNHTLMPLHNLDVASDNLYTSRAVVEKHAELINKGGKHAVGPVAMTSEFYTGKPNRHNELMKFTTQIGGIPLDKNRKALPPHKAQDPVAHKKHILRYFRG